MLVAVSMFLPWVDTGSRTVDFWGLGGFDGLSGDTGTYRLALVLIPLLVLWCAVFFALRAHETRMAWAFGGLTGSALLYGGDLRLSEDLPAGALAAGETVATIGLVLLIAGCVLAVAANIPEPAARTEAAARRPEKAPL